MAKDRLTGLAETYAYMDTIPDAASRELQADLAVLGYEILSAQRRDVAKDTGNLAASLAVTLERLRVKVGLFGIKGGRARDAYYGRFVEFGRRAQTVLARRRLRRSRSGRSDRAQAVAASYTLRVGAMPPRPFIKRERKDLDSRIASRLADYWSRVLGGAGA